MFAAAAKALADEVKASDLASGSLFPSTAEIRRVSAAVAVAVVKVARDSGLGKGIPDAEIPKAVAAAMWNPAYLPTVAVAPRSEVRADDFVPALV
jgi:malic enzyme